MDENYTNMSSSLSTNESLDDREGSNTYILTWWQQMAWSLLFGVMVLAATGGNLIVIWIVLTNRKMRTVTNYFLFNLSMADIMVSTLNVIFNFTYMLNGIWPFGSVYCKISNFIAIVSVAASVFTLMAISIDRYVAIMHPLKPRMSKLTTINITIGIWICSSLLSLPNLLYSTIEEDGYLNGDSRNICYLVWPDGPSNKSQTDYIYNILIFVVTYIFPIISMIFTYFRVGRELWGSQSIGECTARQVENIKSKRKIVKMMIVVVFIFAVCWLPYHVYFILAHHLPAIIDSDYTPQIYLFIYWLAMSNSMYNPMIYCWMNTRFRQGFKNVFLFCLCQRKLRLYEERQTAANFYSCSEAYPDVRVTCNGNKNVAMTTVTETINGSGSSSTPFLPLKFENKNSRLSMV
ncbi:tachykinin-like peptides receptor 99D [Centruroides sculpturatus]|uniref:tachykinin-like peptides receptor 99D n=1 Tax=Centruroides sculpturatus TaxID=218467 RepID=UPI000C6D85DA|nr:tachykinin-like peptides receptor 99D [Centruroides sculpturatus]